MSNPYESTTIDAALANPEKKKSGLFTAICITAIVLGSLGVLSGLVNLAKNGVNMVIHQHVATQHMFQMPAGQMERQRDMQQKMHQVLKRWMPIVILFLLLNIIVSAGMLVGGIGTLRLRSWGRTLLIVMFWLAIVLELAYMIPNISMQAERGRVLKQFTSHMMGTEMSDIKMPSGLEKGMATGVKAGIYVAMGLTIIINLTEVGFYLFGAIYLMRNHVREYFEPPTKAMLVGSQ